MPRAAAARLLPPRLRPLGVKYCPTVSRARRRWKLADLLEDALAERARADDLRAPRSCSAPVTISADDAVPSSTSTTTGIGSGSASPVALKTCAPRACDRRCVTIVPSGMKMLDTSDRLVEQAAAVAAQVEHDPLGALRRAPRRRACRSSPCAPLVKPDSSTIAELDAADVRSRDATTGHGDARALEPQAQRAPAALRRSACTGVPGCPLISAVATRGALARERRGR